MILSNPKYEIELLTYLVANPSILEKAIDAKIIRINKYSGDFPDFEFEVEREGNVQIEKYELEWRTIDFHKHKHPEEGINGIISVDGKPHRRLEVYKIDVPFSIPTPESKTYISDRKSFLDASKSPEIQQQILETLSKKTNIEWSICKGKNQGYAVRLRFGSGVIWLGVFSTYEKVNDAIHIDIQKVKLGDRSNLMKELTKCLRDFGSVLAINKLYKSGSWKQFSLHDFDHDLLIDFFERL